MKTTKFLLIYHLEDGENSLIAYCKTEKETRKTIQDGMQDGLNERNMEVVRVRKISKVQNKIIRSKIVF